MTDPVGGFRIAIRESDEQGRQLFPSDYWGIITGSAMTGHDVSKLTGDLLSDYWQSYNHRASNSWVSAIADTFGASANLRLLSLLGMNRRTPSIYSVSSLVYTSNTARVRIDTYPLSDRIRPVFTVTSKTNLTGLDSYLTGHPIDPPDDPAPAIYSETKLAPTNTALPTGIVGTFTNHYSTERILSGTQTIRVHVRDVNNPTQIPSLTTAQVWQNGSLSLTLPAPTYEKVIVTNSSGGFIFSYSFSNTSLASQSAVMELRLSASTACDFIGIEAVFGLTGYLYDSGDIQLSDDNLAARPDITFTGTLYAHVEMSDLCWYVTSSYTKVAGGTGSAKLYHSVINPGDPDGRFRAGRFIASDAVITPINGQNGWNLRTSTESSPARTRGGSFHGSRQSLEWLEADLSIIGISRVLRQKIERLCRTLGLLHNPTLLVPDPAMTEGYIDEQTQPRWMVLAGKEETHIGRVTFIPQDADSDGLSHTGDQWDLALRWIEHNGHKAGGGA